MVEYGWGMSLWQIDRALLSPGWLWGVLCVSMLIASAVAWHSGATSGWAFAANAPAAALVGEAGKADFADNRGRRVQTDFVSALPKVVSTAPLLAELDRASSSAGVVLMSTTVAARPPVLDSLGHLDVSARMRGTYPAVKQSLKEVLERFPNATLSSLRASFATITLGAGDAAGGAGPSIEAATVLRLWVTPAQQIGAAPAATTAPVSRTDRR
jgi:hypothetical protein